MALAENKRHTATEEGTWQHETDWKETQNRKLNMNKNREFNVETGSSG